MESLRFFLNMDNIYVSEAVALTRGFQMDANRSLRFVRHRALCVVHTVYSLSVVEVWQYGRRNSFLEFFRNEI